MNLSFSKKEIFPEPLEAFNFKISTINEIKNTCLFVPDTNALLMPFTTGVKSINSIKGLYSTLREQDRIFVPAHVVREFLDNRSTKIMELYDALSKKMNQNFNYVDSLPLLEELEEFQSLSEQEIVLKDALKKYRDEIKKVLSTIKSWSWNDPVTEMYQEVLFDRIMTDTIDYESIVTDLDKREKLKIPPGYKDNNKESNDAGDLIIWREICQLGEEKNQDIIFISGEEKNDWWHKSNKETIYPRYELVDEFRRKSNGHSFHIVSLSRFLELFNTNEEVVQEVKREEGSLKRNVKTAYSSLSNDDLRTRALVIVDDIRQRLYSERIESDRYSNLRMAEVRSATSDEERSRIWNKWNEIDRNPTAELIHSYNNLHKVETILLRDEIKSRLPENYGDDGQHDHFRYEHPTNPIGLEDVASNLEMIAKSLP